MKKKIMITMVVTVALFTLLTLMLAYNNNNICLGQSSQAAAAIISSSGDSATAIMKHLSSSTNISSTSSSSSAAAAEISYDTHTMTHRSAKQEWQPHRGQTATSQEWWYVTALLHDASGKQYMLFTTVFKYDGKDIPAVKTVPQLTTMLGPSTTIISPTVELSNYDTGFHYYDSDAAIVNPKQIWNSLTNTLSYKTPRYTGLWSFNGHNMTAVLKSLKLSYNLRMDGASQVMWAKDGTYNKEGFIQEGLPGNVSFYYSLPRLVISGKLAYMDESGTIKTVDVVGQGWVDRQWGDFKTYAWEWASLRFDNGARVNLYSFENAHKVGTYQKPDGSLQWIGNFTVLQNGYDKAPSGQWVSFGWSYYFPIDVEGSRHYTVVPFSKNDWICSTHSFCFIEGAGQLIDNDNTTATTKAAVQGLLVGSSVNESMDIRILKNGPYNVNQH